MDIIRIGPTIPYFKMFTGSTLESKVTRFGNRHVSNPKMIPNRVYKTRLPVTANAVKTTFDFGDDEEYESYKKNKDKLNESFKQKNRQTKHHVEHLNKMFYMTCANCGGNDLIRWMEEKWGARYRMSLEKNQEELVLKITPIIGRGMEYCKNMDLIANKLNDLMLMDYVQEAILSYSPLKKSEKTKNKDILDSNSWGFDWEWTKSMFGKEKLKSEILIPLNIYYDGTV